jgi:hypothetical protein
VVGEIRLHGMENVLLRLKNYIHLLILLQTLQNLTRVRNLEVTLVFIKRPTDVKVLETLVEKVLRLYTTLLLEKILLANLKKKKIQKLINCKKIILEI